MSAAAKPASYPGGKAGDGVYQKIISLMPPHRVYIEAFLGGGAILRHKRPAEINIGIEIDAAVIASRWTDHGRPDLAVYNLDARTFFDSLLFDRTLAGETLIYADPPYLRSVRSDKRPLYDFELMAESEHVELLEDLKRLPAMVMVSGYDSELYNDLLAGWRKVQFTGVSRGGPRIETVWMNFNKPAELHDYSFLGNDYRERQDIRRKKARWTARLENMPPQHRYAMFDAIERYKAANRPAAAPAPAPLPARDNFTAPRSAVSPVRSTTPARTPLLDRLKEAAQTNV